MQQRQLRLGDILDDYCPRERRLTNHAVVAMIGPDVKQTRCTTCDAEHEYKHARVPRQRKKTDAPAVLQAPVLTPVPKRVVHDPTQADAAVTPAPQPDALAASGEVLDRAGGSPPLQADSTASEPIAANESSTAAADDDASDERADRDDGGPVHRRLIRAQLPRIEGQAPPPRPAPDFTIRQPGGRPNRFRPRQQRGGQGQGFGSRSNGNVGGGPRHGGGQHPLHPRPGTHHPGRKRSR